MDSLHVVSLNVRGLRGNKRHTVYRWLKEHKFHICLLQETFCTKGFAPNMKKGWVGILCTVLAHTHIAKV